MRKNGIGLACFSVGIAVFAAAGCGWFGGANCSDGPRPRELSDILNADEKGFEKALRRHGKKVVESELPCIITSVNSNDAQQRRNAARLLVRVQGEQWVVANEQRKVVLETKDIAVWTEVMGFFLDPKSETDADTEFVASERHDMIRRALSDKDIERQSIGMKAGVAGKYPEIITEIKKRLESTNIDLLTVALDALAPEDARAQLSRLLKILEDYERGKKYPKNFLNFKIFGHLIYALLRSEDRSAYEAVRIALEKRYELSKESGLPRSEYFAFRWPPSVHGAKSTQSKFSNYLLGTDSVTRNWALDILALNARLRFEKPTPEIVKACIVEIKTKNPEILHCDGLLKSLETGGKDVEDETAAKADPSKLGSKWLEENGK